MYVFKSNEIKSVIQHLHALIAHTFTIDVQVPTRLKKNTHKKNGDTALNIPDTTTTTYGVVSTYITHTCNHADGGGGAREATWETRNIN